MLDIGSTEISTAPSLPATTETSVKKQPAKDIPANDALRPTGTTLVPGRISEPTDRVSGQGAPFTKEHGLLNRIMRATKSRTEGSLGVSAVTGRALKIAAHKGT